MTATGYIGHDPTKLDLAGGTMTGPLLLSGDPTANLGAVTKQYVDAHTSTSPPWQFDVAKYGAVGDGKVTNDGATTLGSAVVTSASASFLVTDVGKSIKVKGAAADGKSDFVSTIAGYTSATTVTMAAPAAATATGAMVMWATDDTAAFIAATNAARTYALGHGNMAQVWAASPGKFFCVAGPLIKGGSTLGNAQVPVAPVPVAAGKVTIEFAGPVTQAALFHWNQSSQPQTSGTAIVSFGLYANGTAQVNDINANGNPCVIGGPTQPNGYGTTALLFSNVLISFKNVSIFNSFSASGLSYGAVDLSGCAEAQFQDFAYGTTGLFSDLQNPVPLSANLSIGLLLPANGNNDLNVLRNVSCIGGYTRALYATEHTVIEAARITYCWSALAVIGSYFNSVGASHAVVVDQISVEGCTRHVEVIGSGQSGQGPVINITGQLDTEGNPIIYDGSNNGNGGFALGTINVTGFNPPQVPNPTGIRVVNLLVQPGKQTTPTFTLGTALMNPYWTYITVTISGGTLTGIDLGVSNLGLASLGGSTAPTMAATGLTSGTFRLPPGAWIRLNGTVLPTVNLWVAD